MRVPSPFWERDRPCPELAEGVRGVVVRPALAFSSSVVAVEAAMDDSPRIARIVGSSMPSDGDELRGEVLADRRFA